MSVPVLDLLPYAVAAAGLAASIWMFVLLKIELQRNARRTERRREVFEASLAALKASVEDLRVRVEEIPTAGASAGPLRHRQSLNLNHRAQVLRLSRRGDRADQIAAAVGIPVQEVELLLKVHQATMAALA